MKKSLLLSFVLLTGVLAKAQIYVGEDGKTEVSLYSHTAAEDISAKNTTPKPVLKAETGGFAVQVGIKGFEFKSGLMQVHFNENYMESDKIPYAKFVGTFSEKVDYTKDGVYKITMKGKFDVHGVAVDREIPATLTVKGDEITIDAKFNVAMKDHNIKIPEAVGNKFTETMEVTVKSVLKKKK
jgi:hypothetical protein